MSDAINDNGLPTPVATEPHGRAALLLVESLIHGLVARSGLSVPEAIEVVQTAIDVQDAISDDQGDDPDVPSPPTLLLSAIVNSLRIDDPGRRPRL